MKFKVTENAMRPASDEKICFYCHEPVGGEHKDGCVLVRKKVMVRLRVEYELSIPAIWGKEEFEFNRNEGTWCATNAIEELQNIIRIEGRCLCGLTDYEFIGDTKKPIYLEEK